MAKTDSPDPAEALNAYRSKRDPNATPEPFGQRASRYPRNVFAIHKHAARKLHWDLRLEINGRLRCWVVPKGPSLDPDTKRMAIPVEDHPVDYVDFEGIIPEGYGAGAMILWDRGRWHPHSDPSASLSSGELHFRLDGHKLRGEWILIRTSPPNARAETWFFKKKSDTYAQVDSSISDTSILSGLSVEDLRNPALITGELRKQLADRGLDTSAPKPLLQLPPMLAETRTNPFDDPGWLFELKYDGFRLLAEHREGTVHLRFRSGRTADRAFPEIVAALSALPYHTWVMDGEIVSMDARGRPALQKLQQRAQVQRDRDIAQVRWSHPVQYMVFDLLFVEGYDLRPLSLVERKEILHQILPTAGPIQYVDHIDGRGTAFFRLVKQQSLEGIMAKRQGGTYQHARSGDWLKIRSEHTELFAVIGFTLPKGSRVGLGGIHLARPHQGSWQYAGRVGSGFSQTQLGKLRAALDALAVSAPVCKVPKSDKPAVWTRAEMVVEVTYLTASDSGIIRQSRFLGVHPSTALALLASPTEPRTDLDEPHVLVPQIKLTNPDKVFFPEMNYTKADLIAYYQAVAPRMLKYLANRPVALHRFPDGIYGNHFFQKYAPTSTPSWVRTEPVEGDDGEREQLIVDTPAMLTYLANLGTLTFHMWTCRTSRLESPDWCVLDFDPKSAPFGQVVQLALATKRLTDELGLRSVVKTSGASGLHVLVPLGARYRHQQAKVLAQLLAKVLTERHPRIATLDRSLDRRDGKVYIDYGQNGRGQLLAAPYTVRATSSASVSTPLEWNEVDEDLRPNQWTLSTVPHRVAQQAQCPLAEVFAPGPDLGRMLERASRVC